MRHNACRVEFLRPRAWDYFLIAGGWLTFLLPGGARAEPSSAATGDATPTQTSHPRFVGDASLPENPATLWVFYPDEQTTRLGNGNVRVKIPTFSDPVVADGTLYVSDRAGRVYALDAATGNRLWMREHFADYVSTPVVHEDRLYVTSKAGVAALSRRDGTILWLQALPPGVVSGAPIVSGGRVFAGGYDGHVHALDAMQGRVIWSHSLVSDIPPDPPGFASRNARFGEMAAIPRGLATDHRTLFVSIFDQSRIVGVDCATGARRWAFQTKGWVDETIAVDDRHVFVGSQDHHCYCVDKSDGTLVWKLDTEARVSSPLIHAGSVYVSSSNGRFYRLDADTGEEQWRFVVDPDYTGRRFINSVPLVTQTSIYFAAGEGQLYALWLKDGSLRWKHRPAPDLQMYCSPATDGRRLFVTTRPNWDDKGQTGLFAIGDASDTEPAP